MSGYDFSDEDDDEPIVFKRPSSSSKSGQLGLAAKNPGSQKVDGSLSRVPSSQSGQCSEYSGQKHKETPSGKISADRISGLSGQASGIQRPKQKAHHTPASSNVDDSHATKSARKDEASDDSDDHKPLNQRLNGASVGVQKQSSIKNQDSYDSEDEKPLIQKFSSAAVEKSSSSNVRKVFQSVKTSSSQTQKLSTNRTNHSDDSEDDKPLVSRVKPKAVGSGSNKGYDSDEKPLTFKPNGSVKKEESNKQKSPKTSLKRPLADTNNSTGATISKKAKVAVASVKMEVNNKVIKKDSKTDSNDDVPLAQRVKSASSSNKKISKDTVKNNTSSKKIKKTTKNSKFSKSLKVPPGSGGGQKWTTLEHNGVIFPPPYKPHGVKMLYNGLPVDLTPEQEEVATMFAVMKDTEYATKKQFIENFFNDWKKILGKNHVIKKFELCDFTPIYEWHLNEKEKKKQMTTEEKKALKEEKLKQEEKFMWAVVDGVKEKVGNFRVEPPALFRGRGEHPKMGKLKKRIRPRDITINIGKGSPVPECPIPGERWKEVRHDNTVTWLAFWIDPINQKEFKYVFLAASSALKGQSDKEKYEKARKLKDYIKNIRENYERDFTNKDLTRRQIAVATYLIDKLALRAGNEKDDDEADTVGCCTLKVENVELVPPNKIKFDFLGKDSIRYLNTVEVDVRVYKAIGDFQTDKRKSNGRKNDGDDLFDMLDTSKLNAHLKELMPGLTAKVFRTYNASITLDEILNQETKDGTVLEKIAVYQHANKEVAIICNHQRTVSKSHESQMSRLNEKIDELKAQQEEFKVDLTRAKKGKPPLKDKDGKTKKVLSPEVLEKKIAQIDAKLEKMELDKKLKEDLKTVALGTSKINYLDPRISVAWCKRHEVPIEKIFNKSLLAKFAWAMDVDPTFRF